MLDANALSHVATQGGATHREQLETLVASGAVVVPLTFPLVNELLAMGAGHPHFAAVSGAVRSLTRGVFLQPLPDRIIAEAANGGRLPLSHVLAGPPATDDLMAAFSDPAFVEQVAADVAERKARYDEVESPKPDQYRAELTERFGLDRRGQNRATAGYFGKDLREVVADWVAGRLDRVPFVLDAHRERAPNPSTAPSLWYSMSFHVARIALELADQKGVKGGDLYDWAHVAEAAYADVFVSDDNWLHRVWQRGPLPEGRLVRMRDLEAAVLAQHPNRAPG